MNGCSYTSAVNGNSTTITPTQGTIQPVTAWSAPTNTGGTSTGNVHDFVTWAADPTCSQTSTPGSLCSTTNDYKRVTVVVTLNGATQPTNPAIVSGLITQPSTGRNPGTSSGTVCTENGQQIPCTQCTTNCTTTNPPPCTGTGCGPPASSPCYAPQGASLSWLTPAVPVGTSLTLTGTGNVTLYLEQTSGSAVTTNLCIGLYVVPGGILGGTLAPIGVAFTNSMTLVSGVPTPVTLNFSSGLGTAGYLVSGIAGTDVELVTSAQASSTPVQILNDPTLGFTDQATLDEVPT